MLRATNSIADSKHADQPAAKSCSGLVPVPGPPGRDSVTSRRPSELRDMPARPPVVWTFAVYSTFSSRFITSSFNRRMNAARSDSCDGGSVSRALAAIDVNGFARYEARRFQIEDRAHDVRDLAHPAKRVQLGELRVSFGGMHRRLDDAGRNRIHSDAELCILDRQRFGRGAQASFR